MMMRTHDGAGAGIYVADGVVMGAAAAVVLAARGALEGAAAPVEAHAKELKEAAARIARWAGVVLAADGGGRHGCWRGWRGWARVRWVRPLLDRVRRLHCNSTQPCLRLYIPLHSQVPCLPPSRAPRVPHDPVVHPIFGTVTNRIHAVVQVQATLPCEDPLSNKKEKNKISSNISRVSLHQYTFPCMYILTDW